MISESLRERKKERVRNRILEVARELFRERGFAGTSMDDIAAEADISRKTLFNYMTSKEAIVVALKEEWILDHVPEWYEPEEAQYGDVRDVVAPGLDERLKGIAENRWLVEIAAEYTHYYNSGRGGFMHPVLEKNFAARTKRIAAIQKKGLIRNDLPPEWISWYYEALRDLATKRWLSDPESTEADLKASFDAFMDVLFAGLSPQPDRVKPKGRRRPR